MAVTTLSPKSVDSWSVASGTKVVDAERHSAKCDDLEQSAGHHHVLEEVDHLVLVGKVAVER
jgi:hypothetical protein